MINAAPLSRHDRLVEYGRMAAGLEEASKRGDDLQKLHDRLWRLNDATPMGVDQVRKVCETICKEDEE
jgi:hypothetical protein